MLPVLLEIARQPTHAIHNRAIRALRPFAARPEAAALLNLATQDIQRFPSPHRRAEFATAVGDQELAVALISPLIADDNSYDSRMRVRLLGTYTQPDAVQRLLEVTEFSNWSLAVEAMLALENWEDHALTDDQRDFLKVSNPRFKARFKLDSWRKVAQLNKLEIKPLVLRNIVSDRPRIGLFILSEWRDRDALPHISDAMPKIRSSRQPFLNAAMVIDDSKERIDRAFTDASFTSPIRAVWQSNLPAARKREILLYLRRTHLSKKASSLIRGIPLPLSKEGVAFLEVLLKEETNISVLASGCEWARKAKPPREDLILLALHRGRATPPTRETAVPLARILRNSSGIPGAGEIASEFLRSPQLKIRIAAAEAAAMDDAWRGKALDALYEELPASRDAILGLPCRDNVERLQRESAVLTHLGQPTESAALRLLATCCGERTMAELEPWLDDEDVMRALHAAWILRNAARDELRQRAERRMRIYRMFHCVSIQGVWQTTPGRHGSSTFPFLMICESVWMRSFSQCLG